MEDNQIVQLYWDRDENAIKYTEQKYGKYCHSIAKNILENSEDAEECVNDTYVSAWNTIPPHKPNILATFLKSNSVNNHSDTEVVQLPNPLVEVQSLEEMENELDFKVPTLEKEVETYIIINGEDSKSARIMYADGSVFDMAHGTGDISGIWGGTFEKEEQIDNVNVSFYKYKGEENTINYVLWEKDGFTYSYSGEKISVDEIQSLVRQ